MSTGVAQAQPTDLTAESPDSDVVKVGEKNPFAAAFLSWLVPGLGHLYLNRPWKGLVLFVTILGCAAVGGMMFKFDVIATVFKLHFVAQTGLGLPGLALAWMNQGLTGSRINEIMTSERYEISMLYVDVAGLLNYLVAVHALLVADMSVYARRKPAAPSPEAAA